MKITAIQMESHPNKELNLQATRNLIYDACENAQPDLILLPEMFAYLGECPVDRANNAEVLLDDMLDQAPAYMALKALAKECGVIIHAGSLCEKVDHTYYNTSVVFDKNGDEIGRYRKVHLFEINHQDTQCSESAFYSSGNDIFCYQAVINDHTYTIGSSICFDLRFPMLYQQLVERGCDIIMIPSAFFYTTGKDHWDVLCRARAIETQCYVVASAQTTQETNTQLTSRRYWGHSTIIDPWGTVLCQAGTEVGHITATIDHQKITSVRNTLPLASCKRPFNI